MAHSGYLLYFAAWLIVAVALTGFFAKYMIPLFIAFALFVFIRYKCRRKPLIKPISCKQVPPTPSGERELMFCMHGWPDDARIWKNFRDYFNKKDYTCVTYTLPGYDIRDGYNIPHDGFYWGYDIPDMVDCIALTLKDALARNSKSSCILVSHDWGAVLCQALSKKHPELVHKVIMFDVQLDPARVNWATIWIIGFAYQFWLVLAFLVSSIPAIGPPVGNAMTRSLASAQGAPLSESPEDIERTGAFMNYLYFYLLKECLWHKFSGDAKKQKPQEGSDLAGALLNDASDAHAPGVPTLFFYTIDLFHHQGFERELRERADCDVIKLPPVDENGKACGHWFVYKNTELIIPKVENWLQTGKKEGPYTGPVVGHTG